MTYKITIPHLTFCGNEVETPIGLSDLLEKAWVPKNEAKNCDISSNYVCERYKDEFGRWVSKFRKVI